MPMTPREVVRRTIRFEGADRIPYALTPEYGSDFAGVGMNPSPDARPRSGVDEWGCAWENIGVSNLGVAHTELSKHKIASMRRLGRRA